MKTTRLGLIGGGVLAAMIVTASLALAVPSGQGDPTQGQYIFHADGGCGCHGSNLAGFKEGVPPGPGGEMFAGPFGTVAALNITQDQDTGVGAWTDEQLINAIRNGVDDKGEMLFPIMPYNSFHFMSDEDVTNLVAYLRTVPPVSNRVPERELNIDVPPAPPLPPSPAMAPASGIERGRYLVTAISLCGDCHTPSLPDGSPDMSKMLAGNFLPNEDGTFEIVPNITTDPDTGIDGATVQQIATFLQTGVAPDGSMAKGRMLGQIMGGYNQLTDDDAMAIGQFVLSLPPVSNTPMAPDGTGPENATPSGRTAFGTAPGEELPQVPPAAPLPIPQQLPNTGGGPVE